MSYEYEKFTTLPQLLTFVSKTTPNPAAFSYKEGSVWKHISTESFVSHVLELAYLLQKNGMKKGDTVGILSPSSPFWLMADFAISSIGTISVPFLEEISDIHLS